MRPQRGVQCSTQLPASRARFAASCRMLGRLSCDMYACSANGNTNTCCRVHKRCSSCATPGSKVAPRVVQAERVLRRARTLFFWMHSLQSECTLLECGQASAPGVHDGSAQRAGGPADVQERSWPSATWQHHCGRLAARWRRLCRLTSFLVPLPYITFCQGLNAMWITDAMECTAKFYMSSRPFWQLAQRPGKPSVKYGYAATTGRQAM